VNISAYPRIPVNLSAKSEAEWTKQNVYKNNLLNFTTEQCNPDRASNALHTGHKTPLFNRKYASAKKSLRPLSFFFRGQIGVQRADCVQRRTCAASPQCTLTSLAIGEAYSTVKQLAKIDYKVA